MVFFLYRASPSESLTYDLIIMHRPKSQKEGVCQRRVEQVEAVLLLTIALSERYHRSHSRPDYSHELVFELAQTCIELIQFCSTERWLSEVYVSPGILCKKA